MNSKITGALGERLVCQKYIDNKYAILYTNFRTKFGEIDIIAQKADTLVFIEVKTRCKKSSISAKEAVDFYKQCRIKNTAKIYLQKIDMEDLFVRFDVAEVYIDNKEIIIIEDAFI